MPLEHSPVTERLVPYLQHDHERRAAHARTLRIARAARKPTRAGRGPRCATCA